MDPEAGLGVDPLVDGGVVAAQDPPFDHAPPGEALALPQPGAEVRGRLATRHRVDHLLAFGQLDHPRAGAGQLLGPLGDQLHDRFGVEIAADDFGLVPMFAGNCSADRGVVVIASNIGLHNPLN